MKRFAMALWGAAALWALAGCATGAASAPKDCEALAGMTVVAGALGLPSGGAQVASASVVASGAAPAYCRVVGAIKPVHAGSPDINFQVNLPNAWNDKAVHYGGGGYDGTLVTGEANIRFASGATPLALGYVTFGSDSGHRGAVADGSFALDAEALRNFGGDQLKKTHDVAMALIQARYARLPRRTYFAGNSQGGHEALVAIQRWPADYDGATVTHPVYDFVALQLAGNRAARAMYAPGAWLSPAKLALLDAKVREVCDALDGVVDGLVSNVAGCDRAFDIDAYRCAGGTDTGDSCFSDAQIAALKTLNTRTRLGFALQDGVDGFARWPIFEGAALAGLFAGGKSAQPHRPAQAFEDFGLYVLADPAMRFFFAQDPDADSLTLDPARYRERIVEVSNLVDANRVSLDAFEAHGGKLLLMHGTSDFAVSVHNTTDYYERLVAHFGQARLDRFAQYYVVPGFAHGGGPFDMTWDPLGTLDGWVDQGRVPEHLVATDINPATQGRSRPMCRYPSWPKYVGPDASRAASFVCSR